jgi:hypothetical protein
MKSNYNFIFYLVNNESLELFIQPISLFFGLFICLK